MKKLFCFLVVTLICNSLLAQFVATMEVKEHIEGVCNEKQVYALLPMLKGQEEAPCPLTNAQIEQRLNQEVTFLKEHPKYKDKGMVNIIINCKGEVVKCEMDNKTKSEELDKQIVAVFNSLGQWKPGKLNGNEVDSSRLWSFEVKKGKITLD